MEEFTLSLDRRPGIIAELFRDGGYEQYVGPPILDRDYSAAATGLIRIRYRIVPGHRFGCSSFDTVKRANVEAEFRRMRMRFCTGADEALLPPARCGWIGRNDKLYVAFTQDPSVTFCVREDGRYRGDTHYGLKKPEYVTFRLLIQSNYKGGRLVRGCNFVGVCED